MIVATAFHEFGHASACRYSGARPGVMGVGFYVVYPAFYCDVTDAYRLDRAGRLRTDLGGVYFNAIFALLAGAVFFATGEEAALLAAVVQHVIMFQQLLPLLRFDGYYVLTDLTGVPDILSRIKPIFRSLVRGRRNEPKVAELKPWVRVAVTAYLVTLIPTLVFLFTWMVMGAPRLISTVHDSIGLQFDRIAGSDGFAEAGVGALRMTALILPVASISVSLSRTSRAAALGLTRWSRGSVRRRPGRRSRRGRRHRALAYTWWPNGDYEPLRPGERGTIGETLSSMPKVLGGRPSFTPERALEYGTVPTVREAEATQRGEESSGESEPGRAPDGSAGSGTDDSEGSSEWGEEGYLPPDRFDSDRSSDYDSSSGDTSAPAPDSTTTTPDGTTTQPAPTDSGTSTAPAPAPSDSTSTTPTEPAPSTTTESAPTEPLPERTDTLPTDPLTESAPAPGDDHHFPDPMTTANTPTRRNA